MLFLKTEAQAYGDAFKELLQFIDGFQAPLGMEALATVDWLVTWEGCEPSITAIKKGIRHWPGTEAAAKRKERIFSDPLLQVCLERLQASALGW